MEEFAPPASGAPNTAEPAVPLDANALRLFLAGREISCTRCGYNLRDLSGDKCPECGGKLTLWLNTAEPSIAAVIAGLIGLSMAAGVCVFFLLALGYSWLQPNFGGDSMPGLRFSGSGVLTICSGSAIFLWIYNGRALQKRPWALQCTLAIACWLFAVGLVYCVNWLLD